MNPVLETPARPETEAETDSWNALLDDIARWRAAHPEKLLTQEQIERLGRDEGSDR